MKTRTLASAALALSGLLLPGLSLAEECQITLSQAVIDYKQLRRENIVTTQQEWHKMPEREMNVSVFCPQKQQMAVLLQGNAGEKGRFQFGQQGGLAVKVENMMVDGKPYTAGKTLDQLSFTPQSDTGATLYLRNNEAVIAVENNQVPQGQQMNFTVTLFPVLKDDAFGHISDQTALESDLTWRLLIN